MAKYRIVALPGDGIGPEVMAAALEVVRAAGEAFGVELDVSQREAGAEHYRRTGVVLPEDVLQQCLAADAVLLSAIGLPDVRKPDGTEVQPDMMMGLRRAMGLYGAVRPIKLYPGVPTPLRHSPGDVDFVIVRENLEGLFASYGGGCVLEDQAASDTILMTRRGVERVAELAFQLARRRTGRPCDGRRIVTCVDKANVFRSYAFFRKIFFEVAQRYADVDAEAAHVDAMSYAMVVQPQRCDVLVMENQFGDILSDLGAALAGGLGMAPSAELGAGRGLFQPSHGSAPDIAGSGRANPLAMILSAAMMFRWLGERREDASAQAAGEAIERAAARLLAEGRWLPQDLGGSASTAEVGRAVGELIA